MRNFSLAMFVALSYFLIGRASLLLAIPPGFATAIWPASGIALFSLIRFGWAGGLGVFVGHMAVNLSMGGTEALYDPTNLGVSFGIAVGGASQALLGRVLIKRSIGLGNLLIKERRIYRFMLFGGPLACLISPTVGVLVLYFSELIPLSNVPFTWMTWWVGDSMGVMIFAPVLLILFQSDQSIWRVRIKEVVFPMLLVFGLACLLFVFVRDRMEADHFGEFHKRIKAFGEKVEEEVGRYERILSSLNQLQSTVEKVDREIFRRYTSHFLEEHPNLMAISWNPMVEKQSLEELELKYRQELPAFSIKEKAANGAFVKASIRDWYVPITYIEPWSQNKGACGYDIASNPLRKKAILAALKEQEVTVTDTIDLVQTSKVERGLLMIRPVMEVGEQESTGFYVCVFHVERLLTGILPPDFEGRTYFSLNEVILGEEKVIISNHDGDSFQPTMIRKLKIGDRIWVLKAAPTLKDLAEMRNWRSWLILILGMLFTSLFCVYLFVASGRRHAIQLEVDQRTSELNLEVVKRRETEGKLMVEKFNAEKATVAKSVFLANMSHEIRTPMNGILGASQLLLGSDMSQKQLDNVQLIHQSTSSLLTILNDILDFSKLEVGKMTLSLNPVDTNSLFKNLEMLFLNQAEAKGLSFKVEYKASEELPDFIGDETRIRQILVNLTSNAIKFTENGHVALRAYTQEIDDQWIFGTIVEDTGIGMSQEQSQRIFERFEQAESDTSRRFGGTGLGMSICKSLIDLMGGNLRVESAEGKGSVFYLEVPIEGCEKVEEKEEKSLDRNYGKTIILAEDSATNRLIATMILGKLGLKVLEAKNGQDVLDLVAQDHTLILMDIQMPVMDGLEATQKLFGDGYEKPILALTANISAEEKDRYRELGMKDVLAKPLEMEKLVESLDRWLS